MGIISSSPTLSGSKGSSTTKNTAVGSGSRPTKSKYPIPSSAPSDQRTLGRAPEGWLGDTQKKEAPFS
jgi:hypothetical protein